MRHHHVQLSMPAGQEDVARSFYRDALGLVEVDKPEPLDRRGGCWFRRIHDGETTAEIHLGVEQVSLPLLKAHPAFVLDSNSELEALAEQIQASGFDASWEERDTFPGFVRFHCRDPFGNRLEFLSPR